MPVYDSFLEIIEVEVDAEGFTFFIHLPDRTRIRGCYVSLLGYETVHTCPQHHVLIRRSLPLHLCTARCYFSDPPES